ncbi:cold shock domain-containing protein [Bradyrhizobium sp. 166]|uniref:cold-shock protein n=1 Tax=Bradyrhizobium sp. 166 TaxID=2782638 RepID=UPI001FF955DE|nr:cold shock domain-containing protein [Bradyrhizobium sp. 166]MCK1603913.1 cold shock domain-containing protein [Bradyrhizobium sp. 166]
MASGVCVGWFEERGYGWIRPDSGGADIFVHRRSLQGSVLWLDQGHRVEFEIGLDARTGKPHADSVRLI